MRILEIIKAVVELELKVPEMALEEDSSNVTLAPLKDHVKSKC